MADKTDNVQISRGKLEEIFSTPKECWEFLTVDVGFHLPDRPYVDMNWMSQIWDGTRKAVKSEEVDMRRVPSVKHLRTADVIQFLKDHGSENYLQPPKKKDISEKWSRPWLCQVSSSIASTP